MNAASEEVDEPFMALTPQSGWLHDYLSYTAWAEGPAPFQFFVACATLGAVLRRNVWFEKGHYNIYPNFKMLLVAPTGKCRKTSTANIGIKLLYRTSGINIIQDKVTPEGIVQALLTPPEPQRIIMAKDKDKLLAQLLEGPDAQGILYAPELAVLLGKQKYNEGMITLLTSLFDDPDEFVARTKAEGAVTLRNVNLTFLGASTSDWLASAIPQDAFGGGFMSRILFVVQEESPRCFPIPKRLESDESLVSRLVTFRDSVKGVVTFAPDAQEWFVLWYTAGRKGIPEDAKMAGYHERKPDHMIRLAMVLALSERRMQITRADLLRSSMMLEYLEKQMLFTFKWLGIKLVGHDAERITRILKSAGGKMHYHDLLRKLIFYMNKQQFRAAIDTLCDAKIVVEIVTASERYFVYKGGE